MAGQTTTLGAEHPGAGFSLPVADSIILASRGKQTFMFRVGITGSGFMGRTHLEAAHRLSGVEPVAVAGGSRAAGLAADYGIEAESDTQSLIARSDIDGIVIATPHHCHVEEALLAANEGKHVLVEKPMATTVEDSQRMINAFEQAGLQLAVGYHQRFRESNRTVRDLVNSGAIGQVRAIQMSALFDIEALRSDEGFGGGWDWWKDPRSLAHLMNSGPHNVDLCRWWLGSEICHVAACSGTFREENPNENTTMALLAFQNGSMASFWSSSVCPSPGFPDEDFRFRIMGDEGLIDANPFGQIRIGRAGQWDLAYEQPKVAFDDSQAAFTSSGRMAAYCDQMQGWLDRIGGRESETGTGRDGRAGVAAVVAMLEAAANKHVVVLDSPPEEVGTDGQ